MIINEKTKLAEILDKEEIFDVLIDNNFPCVHCPMASMEDLTIKEICEGYNVDFKKLKKDLKELS